MQCAEICHAIRGRQISYAIQTSHLWGTAAREHVYTTSHALGTAERIFLKLGVRLGIHYLCILHNHEQRRTQGRTQDFLRGGGTIFFFVYSSQKGVEIQPYVPKLFIILQASSILPHNKKLRKIDFKSCISYNLTKETLKM